MGVSELKALASSGSLALTDLVSRDGRNWCKASEVKGLEFASSESDSSSLAELDGFDPLKLMGTAPSTGTIAGPSLPDTLKVVSDRSPLNLMGCPDCSGLVSMRAIACPHCGCPIQQRGAKPTKIERRYRMVRVLGIGYFIGGAIALAAAALSGMIFLSSMSNGDTNAAMESILFLVGALTAAVTSLAMWQIIELVLQLEENTRATATVLEDRL
jgi:hypothetical protein